MFTGRNPWKKRQIQLDADRQKLMTTATLLAQEEAAARGDKRAAVDMAAAGVPGADIEKMVAQSNIADRLTTAGKAMEQMGQLATAEQRARDKAALDSVMTGYQTDLTTALRQDLPEKLMDERQARVDAAKLRNQNIRRGTWEADDRTDTEGLRRIGREVQMIQAERAGNQARRGLINDLDRETAELGVLKGQAAQLNARAESQADPEDSRFFQFYSVARRNDPLKSIDDIMSEYQEVMQALRKSKGAATPAASAPSTGAPAAGGPGRRFNPNEAINWR